ncbi:hypothetical protein [Streptomyces sp. NPDC059166]|uniref:hypothetical protein n=1 Tax=Streptomyces sp. NPDC059166 TaxID=3346752 RepID=UPI00367CFBFA
MQFEAGTFPSHPIRGVRAVYAWQSTCPSDFAEVVVDFEPGRAGITLETAPAMTVQGDVLTPEELSTYRAAIVAGVREEVAQLVPGTPAAVAVVLRKIRVHPVDSHPRSFHMVGRVAVRNALGGLRPAPRPSVKPPPECRG